MSAAGPAMTALRRWASRANEPHILFPAIGIVVLGLIWGTTLSVILDDRRTAERAAVVSTHALSETYEAQVVRVLREIDQALRFVKYSYELSGAHASLQDLKARSLLPPDLLFVVAIADPRGRVLASTRASSMPSAVDPETSRLEHEGGGLRIDRPRVGPDSGAWSLQFSRGLYGGDGEFAGTVSVTVDAAHFVSGYEASSLGAHGLLAIVRNDGLLLARRSGESMFFGERIDYATVAPADATTSGTSPPLSDAWDGIRRYTSAHAIHDFPVTVLVGVSHDERLAPVRQAMHGYLWRAGAASMVVILVLTLLGRMSRELARGRALALQDQVAHAARVEHIAYHDGLTGLANRSLFSKLLAQGIKLAHRHKRRLAVLFLDLDRFKLVNDTLGHDAGDQLLQAVASRLRGCLRESDTVARLGGDEFVVLLPDLEEEGYVAGVAQKITDAIARPFVVRGQELSVTASVGIGIYPEDGLDEQLLCKSADIAMYQAKALGRNNYQFFSERLNASSLERLTLESDLRLAVERGEFELHYQAKRDTASRRVTGMEALLRWHRPGVGTLAPLEFIAAAEETGLIVPIGKWGMRTACLQSVAWCRAGLPRLVMAVNLSSRQFHDPNLGRDLGRILAETGIDPGLLELEISESLLMRDVEAALVIMAGLKELGVRIAIDDFGAGYLALAALRKFPLDTIKIDRSFILDLGSTQGELALTRAVIAMGRALSPNVVAQGVESWEQAEFVRGTACGEFQGFYMDTPGPADRVSELLRDQANAHAADVRAIGRAAR